MKLTDLADTIKNSDGRKLDHLSAPQIARILSHGLREIRVAIEGSSGEVVVVPGLGRFRNQQVNLKPKAEGEPASTRRVTRFVPAKARIEAEEAATAEAQ